MSINLAAATTAAAPADGAPPLTPRQPTAFDLKLQLAYERGRDLVFSYDKAIDEVARLTAIEGLPIESPLIDIAAREHSYIRDLVWRFQRAYWAHRPDNDPAHYFRLTPDGSMWVRIESLGVAGAKGNIHLHKNHVSDFFRCARYAGAERYESWAMDPYPVGGQMVLLRMESCWGDYEGDDHEHILPPDEEGTLRIDPDTHPSDGALYFGDPSQELRQIGALCRLKDAVWTMFSQNAPTPEERAAAQERANRINTQASRSFMPHDGYCYRCKADVTKALEGMPPGACITGCPICSATWCD